jgi:mannose-6-phosphate isomerase
MKPSMPASSQHPQLAQTFATVWQHFLNGIVPLWEGPGWNPTLALPYEALDDAHQPLPVQRYRAMACARQLFLFTSLGDRPGAAERAAALFTSLDRHFADPVHGGWFYSVGPQGAPLDTRKDLYTHAFVLFACAHYLRRAPAAGACVDRALAAIERFAIGDGLYTACLGENWASLGEGPLQNPLMHLAEAFLATLDARPSATTEAALQALCDGMHQRFFDPGHQVLLEKPVGTVDNWYEPGHQFEWFYLLASSPFLASHPLAADMAAALGRSEAQGVRDSAVCASLAAGGALLDGTRRIWAQAEYLRALSLLPARSASLAAQLQALQAHFLRAAGWYECRDAEGAVNRHDMPSTTPYHLYTCLAAVAVSPAVAGGPQTLPKTE